MALAARPAHRLVQVVPGTPAKVAAAAGVVRVRPMVAAVLARLAHTLTIRWPVRLLTLMALRKAAIGLTHTPIRF